MTHCRKHSYMQDIAMFTTRCRKHSYMRDIAIFTTRCRKHSYMQDIAIFTERRNYNIRVIFTSRRNPSHGVQFIHNSYLDKFINDEIIPCVVFVFEV